MEPNYNWRRNVSNRVGHPDVAQGSIIAPRALLVFQVDSKQKITELSEHTSPITSCNMSYSYIIVIA